jgi:hypothetical protein
MSLVKEIEDFNHQMKQKSEDKVNIICTKCKGRVGYIVPAECEIPLNGGMIHKHPGCENWDMPLHFETAKDFICPHAADPETGDKHLFIEIREGHHEEADCFLTEEHKPYRIGVITGKCPCGCGGNVRLGNKYADNLRCYRRAMARLRTEM